MLDFRYHALSLVAVFLALAIGIVLGVTIGDALLSEAERGVRSSLRSDVVQAREDADEARQAVRARDAFVERVTPGLVRARLAGRRVAIISWGELPEAVEDGVRDGVRRAGGRVDSASELSDLLADLGEVVGEDQLNELADAGGLRSFGSRLALAIAEGDDLPADLRDLEGNRFRGRYAGADAVAFFHAPEREGEEADEEEDEDERDEAGRLRDLEEGLVEALADMVSPVVGVEVSGTEPSQVSWYRGKGLTSVDSVDLVAGQAALVFALGGAEGAFGLKPSAGAPLPDADELGF